MKKILSLVLIFICFKSFAQFPSKRILVNDLTIIEGGALRPTMGFVNGIYTDTTAANAGYIDFYNGAQIWTRSDRNFWLRDSVLNTWIRIAKYAELASGSRFGVEDAIAGQSRAFDANYNSFGITKISTGQIKSGTGSNYSDFAFDSTLSRINLLKGSDIYHWELNANNGWKYAGLGAINSSGTNFFRLYGDSTSSNQRISYPGNIHGTFFPYSLVDKSYVDSVSSGGLTGSGVANRIAVWSGTSSLTSASGLIWDGADFSVPGGIVASGGNTIYTTGLIHGGYVEIDEAGALGTVPSGVGQIWVKNDGTLHFKNDAQVDIELGSGSSATNNTNVGSGYRWLKPTPQEIKTAFNGINILIDSSSNTDGLTIHADTTNGSTKLATQGDITRAITTVSGLQDYARFDVFDNCLNSFTANGWDKLVSGTGTSVTYNGTPIAANWNAQAAFSTGTTNAGLGIFTMNNGGSSSQMFIDGAARLNYGMKIWFDSIFTSTDDWEFFYGFANNSTLSSVSHGIFVRCNRTDSSGKFILCTESANVRTERASLTTVEDETTYRIDITITESNVDLYINDVYQCSVTSGFPASNVALNTTGSFWKTAGTIPRKMYVDYLKVGTIY